jgi:chromosome segregation protein
VHFTKLRLSGFKSFVEASDFRIEPGLTGIVGPNGCGKSNLLEALRWVMGANSAKAMRGEGMDDVIFSGSGARPSRNHAEVSLTIDNADGTAPAGFNAHPVLEVTRRIDRGEGSTYRVNGREVRARDVQLLFADASTGSNSPALVRQGQISELIAARPQNRRRILEEAAGISGLHSRRHEAELRVRAAETNVERLDDVMREIESSLGRLRREARAAAKYKTVAAGIRTLQGAVLHARWSEAGHVLERCLGEAAAATREAQAAAVAAAAASTAAVNAEAAIRPLRDEEMAASAVLGRLAIEKDRMERAVESAAAEASRLVAELARIDTDAGREGQIIDDAGRALSRLEATLGVVEQEIAAAPERLPELTALARTAEAARSEVESRVEALATALAAAEAEGRAAEARLADAQSRTARAGRALIQARTEREALGFAPDPGLESASVTLASALAALELARETLEAGESERSEAQSAESAARHAARAAEDELGRAMAEARGLAQLNAATTTTGFAPVLNVVSPQSGLEAALAAALGDDLNAALDKAAPSFWGGRASAAPDWPAGASPLADLVSAPPQLAARLAFTALVARTDGPRLAVGLPPGARLVSREGDLWRWDGFTVTAEAPRPAQVRLEQKARHAAIESKIKALKPAAEAARANQTQAAARVAAADSAVRLARAAPRTAEFDVTRAREALERLERDGARRDARAQSLDQTIASFAAELVEAETVVSEVQAAAVSTPRDEDVVARLQAARSEASGAREAAALARSALDAETRDRDARARRLLGLRGEQAEWAARARTAQSRQTFLAKDRAAASAALVAARNAPADVEARRQRILDEYGAAESRKVRAVDALAAAEAARANADRETRAADARAADAREARATVMARTDAARERRAEYAATLTETTGLTPEALGDALGRSPIALPSEPGDAERRLAALERERDMIGPVNLLAEEEAAEFAERLENLDAERADLTGALSRLRQAIHELNAEGRTRLTAAFEIIDGHFRALFTTLFQGGQAELRLVESEDPLEAGLEILACPPGKRMAVMSLMSGGEQALTAVALIFAVFLANPAPICVLDEVDAPLDDANVERFCNLLSEMRLRASTRFITITHNPLTMSRMDRLYGVTMRERGVSQLVSVDLNQAEAMAAQ